MVSKNNFSVSPLTLPSVRWTEGPSSVLDWRGEPDPGGGLMTTEDMTRGLIQSHYKNSDHFCLKDKGSFYVCYLSSQWKERNFR